MVKLTTSGFFSQVDLPELLVITGRACTRIMSGYQKTKKDEAKILESLREEGLTLDDLLTLWLQLLFVGQKVVGSVPERNLNCRLKTIKNDVSLRSRTKN